MKLNLSSCFEHWTMLIVLLFLYWFFPYCSQSNQLIKKISYSQISEKYDQTSINLTNVFNFIGSFSNYVGFDEIKWLYALTKYDSQNFIKKPQSASMSW